MDKKIDVQERLARHLSKTPQTSQAAFVASDAILVGDITLGLNASVFYGSILRGDIQSIVIGEATNLQDGVIVHLADEYGVQVGDYTTVGHGAILHACTVGNECLIGMRATVLDGAKIGDQSIVGANSLVPNDFEAPPGSLILGSPAKVVKALPEDRRKGLRYWALKYIEVAKAHAAHCAGRKV